MKFKHNATKFYLLTNKPILFTSDDGEEFELKLPNLESLYTNEDLSFCISFLQQDVEEIQKMLTVPVKNHSEFIHLINSFSVANENLAVLSEKIINGLKELNEGFHFKNALKIDDIVVDNELLNQIIEVLLLSMNRKKTMIYEDDDEFTRAEKAAKIRAERIRRNSKGEKGASIEDMIAGILYAFPQYKIEDLMQKNLYTIYYLFGYIGRIANYEVEIVAFGNGLVKKGQKFKHFIDK